LHYNSPAVTIFRAYDVRGLYKTELNEEIAGRIGRAFGSYADGGRVTLGRDSRTSGPSLEAAFLEGVLATGAEVDSYGLLPIAVISFSTWKGGYKAAAYISASHNPPEYNGIRFRTGYGYGMLYQNTAIMDFYRDGKFRAGEGIVRHHDAKEAIDAYRDYVSSKISIDRPLKVVLDMGNGSACTMDGFYRDLGFQTTVLNGRPDGDFPGRGPSPSEESLQDAARAVVREGADFGCGFDPDADRGIVIDDLGRIVPPEKVAIILAKRRYRKGDLVISGFDCSMMLEKELVPAGFRVERERVGDVFVANRVKDDGAVLGVERSGHFFLPEFQYSDDPFAMSLALAEIISGGEKLSELADEISDYPYKQVSIPCHASIPSVMKALLERLSSLRPDTTDGIKITTETYTVLIRPSNTEPLVRLYIETAGGDMAELLERYKGYVMEAVKACR